MQNAIDWLNMNKAKIMGIIVAAITLLVATGVVTPEGQETLINGVNDIWAGILLALTGLSSIFMLVSNKPDPEVKGAKNLGDFINRLADAKTTVLGIATAGIALLAALGVLKPENQEGIITGLTGFWDGGMLALSGISAIIMLFSKD